MTAKFRGGAMGSRKVDPDQKLYGVSAHALVKEGSKAEHERKPREKLWRTAPRALQNRQKMRIGKLNEIIGLSESYLRANRQLREQLVPDVEEVEVKQTSTSKVRNQRAKLQSNLFLRQGSEVMNPLDPKKREQRYQMYHKEDQKTKASIEFAHLKYEKKSKPRWVSDGQGGVEKTPETPKPSKLPQGPMQAPMSPKLSSAELRMINKMSREPSSNASSGDQSPPQKATNDVMTKLSIANVFKSEGQKFGERRAKVNALQRALKSGSVASINLGNNRADIEDRDRASSDAWSRDGSPLSGDDGEGGSKNTHSPSGLSTHNLQSISNKPSPLFRRFFQAKADDTSDTESPSPHRRAALFVDRDETVKDLDSVAETRSERSGSFVSVVDEVKEAQEKFLNPFSALVMARKWRQRAMDNIPKALQDRLDIDALQEEALNRVGTSASEILAKKFGKPEAAAATDLPRIHKMVTQGRKSKIHVCVMEGEDCETRFNGMTPLMLAVWLSKKRSCFECFCVLARCAETGALDLNQRSPELDGWAAIHIAAYIDGPEHERRVIPVLANCGANLNVRDNNQWTAAHLAAQENKVKIIEDLVEAGASINKQDTNGWTPLHLAAQAGHEEVVKILLQRGAEKDLRDKDGLTAMHWAVRLGDANMLLALQRGGCDVNSEDRSGWTPLHWACFEGDPDCALSLMDFGGDQNAVDEHGWTPYDIAKREGHIFVQSLLEGVRFDDSSSANSY